MGRWRLVEYGCRRRIFLCLCRQCKTFWSYCAREQVRRSRGILELVRHRPCSVLVFLQQVLGLFAEAVHTLIRETLANTPLAGPRVIARQVRLLAVVARAARLLTFRRTLLVLGPRRVLCAITASDCAFGRFILRRTLPGWLDHRGQCTHARRLTRTRSASLWRKVLAAGPRKA